MIYLPNFIYKHISPIISPVLVNIINSCVRQGVFPHKCKVARVFLLFKKGSKLLLVNYRPISILPFLSKMHRCADLNFIHFADDSTVFKTGNDVHHLCNVVNHELEKLDRWLCVNKLSLNVNKSAYTVFTNKDFTNQPNIIIRNSTVSFTNEIKFLGVTIDNKLPFNNHVSLVCNKIAKSIGILRKFCRSEMNSAKSKIFDFFFFA